MTSRRSSPLFFVILALWITLGHASAATYYVSTSGSDSNSGTESLPFKTIQKGVNVAVAGDSVYVRGGTYHEAVMFGRSGEEGKPITLAGYPGERPLLDGEYTLPGGAIVDTDPKTGNTTVSLPMIHFATYSYIVVRNFEIARSHGAGIYASSHDNLIDDVWVREVRTSGINLYNCQRNTVRNSRISESENWAPYPRSASTLNWGGGLSAWGCTDGRFEGNTVFHTWGEGIIIMGAERFVIEDNVSYDNFGLQIYSEHSAYVTIARNLVYNTGDPVYLRDGNPSEGILIADEVGMDQHFPNIYTHDIQVLNNFVTGGMYNFNWAGNLNGSTRWCWEPGDPGGLANSVIANNTFVNARGIAYDPTGIRIDGGVHTNARFENNIIVQETGTIAEIFNDPNLHFSNNLWSRTPSTNASSPNDVIGDPLLAKTGPTGPGELLPDYFKLLVNSPAIDHAKVISEVTGDYFKHLRSTSPDIGAHEYGAAEEDPSPTVPPSAHSSGGSGCASKSEPKEGLWVFWTAVLMILWRRGRKSPNSEKIS
ncbi:MAG: right-handed parallel beta-helix repeat-containing protein [Pseudomonadota bacterium]